MDIPSMCLPPLERFSLNPPNAGLPSPPISDNNKKGQCLPPLTSILQSPGAHPSILISKMTSLNFNSDNNNHTPVTPQDQQYSSYREQSILPNNPNDSKLTYQEQSKDLTIESGTRTPSLLTQPISKGPGLNSFGHLSPQQQSPPSSSLIWSGPSSSFLPVDQASQNQLQQHSKQSPQPSTQQKPPIYHFDNSGPSPKPPSQAMRFVNYPQYGDNTFTTNEQALSRLSKVVDYCNQIAQFTTQYRDSRINP
ncbi:14874_t:CDS:2, partial [Acaulospora morrowiae]